MNVSLLSQVNESAASVRTSLFTQPIVVRLGETLDKSLRNAIYKVIAANATSDISKQFESILSKSADANLQISVSVRITEVFGAYESRPPIDLPEFEILIVSGCSGVGIYENIYEDKNITISIRRI